MMYLFNCNQQTETGTCVR